MSNEEQNQNKVLFNMTIIEAKRNLIRNYLKIISNNIENNEKLNAIIFEWPNQKLHRIISPKIELNKGFNCHYYGELSNDVFHGYGLMIYIDNDHQIDLPLRFYEGQFQNNQKHGQGLQCINNDIYMGRYINNKPQDQNGVFVWGNGDIYYGGFSNGMKHGLGRWQSGKNYYEGQWKFNQPMGQGIIHTENSQYNGSVKRGFKHGDGEEIFANGDHYQGNYANGKPEGNGVYLWNNGAKYHGIFKNGFRFGYGEWVYGAENYQGNYINDKRNGMGVYKWGNSDTYYKGEFVDDIRHGKGQMYWSENSFYRGDWQNGLQQGYGELWQNEQCVQKGLFHKGKFEEESKNKKLIKIEHEKHYKNLTNNKTFSNRQNNLKIPHKIEKKLNHIPPNEIIGHKNHIKTRKNINYSLQDQQKRAQDNKKNFDATYKKKSQTRQFLKRQINIKQPINTRYSDYHESHKKYKNVKMQYKINRISMYKQPIGNVTHHKKNKSINFSVQNPIIEHFSPIKWNNFNQINPNS